MGSLNYANAGESIEIEDHLLAHVRTVAVTKLRRGESFALTVPGEGDASETLWMHAAIPLRFDVSEEVAINRDLLVAMMDAASSSAGLDLTNERLMPRMEDIRRMRAHVARAPLMRSA